MRNRRLLDHILFPAQRLHHDLPQGGFVFDDQNFHNCTFFGCKANARIRKETETAHVMPESQIYENSRFRRNAGRPGYGKDGNRITVSVSTGLSSAGSRPHRKSISPKNRSGRLSNRRKPTSHRSRPTYNRRRMPTESGCRPCAVPSRNRRGTRDRRRRSVAVAVDVDHTLLMVESHAARRGVDDAQVGLMGHQITHRPRR